MIPLIVIVGPTSSGKSDIAIRLAKKFNGEIVSADSRQVYKGLDIGTGKVTKREQRIIPHHMLDVCKPGKQYTLAQFKKAADKAIAEIHSRGKLPFLVGGTPLYTKAVVENYSIPAIKPDLSYRKKLESMSLPKLQALLKKKDSLTYQHIDLKNPRRVIRALEVIEATGASFWEQRQKQQRRYDVLILGVDVPREELYHRIDLRVDQRIKKGMIREVEKLIERGVSKKWLASLGLEYRHITHILTQTQNKVSGIKYQTQKEQMIQALKYAIHDFARRQMVWYRKEKEIQWITGLSQAEEQVKNFLTA